MLSKLLKHEFRATGRVMLPIYAAVLALAVLANLSIRFIQNTGSTFLRILFGLLIAAFVVSVIAAVIMTLVMMITRFYRNLLKDEGYLMHTLPVSVHGLVWSKLIVSFVWFMVTFLVVWLVILLTGLIQTGTSLAQFIGGFPSWAEIRGMLAQLDIRSGQLWALGLSFLAAAILGGLTSCLHFYASMSLGHMFSKDKVLLSIVFFVGISFVLSLLSTGYGSLVFRNYSDVELVGGVEQIKEVLSLMQGITLRLLGMELVQGTVLYLATVLGLKKGLNLA